MPAQPPPKNAFGHLLWANDWNHAEAAAVLGVSTATVSRVAAGKQQMPGALGRLTWLLARHPDLVAELVESPATDADEGGVA